MPKFRPYTADDLPNTLHFLGTCFRDDQFKNYHPGDISHWMSNGYRGDDLDTYFWLYEAKGELIAFAELSQADWGIYTLIINPKLCDSSSELTLLLECQNIMHLRMAQNPPEKRVLSTTVAASNHRRLEQLKNLGYHIEPSKAVVTLKSLKLPIPTPVLPNGFHLRSVAGEHEADLLAEVHNRSFSPKWTGAKYLKVMQTPGFDIARELVVVAPSGRFAAFLIYWLDPVSKVGLLEPVGCHEEFRRLGLATALMYEAMARMVAAGMSYAIVEYHDDNEASTKLYASVGFEEHVKLLNCTLLDFPKLL